MIKKSYIVYLVSNDS